MVARYVGNICYHLVMLPTLQELIQLDYYSAVDDLRNGN